MILKAGDLVTFEDLSQEVDLERTILEDIPVIATTHEAFFQWWGSESSTFQDIHGNIHVQTYTVAICLTKNGDVITLPPTAIKKA